MPPPFVPTCDHKFDKAGYHRCSSWLAQQRKADVVARAKEDLLRSRIRAARRDPQFALRFVQIRDVPVVAASSSALPPGSCSSARARVARSPGGADAHPAVPSLLPVKVAQSHASCARADPSPPVSSVPTYNLGEDMVDMLEETSKRVIASCPKSSTGSSSPHWVRVRCTCPIGGDFTLSPDC